MESNEINYNDSVLSLGIGVSICWLVVTLGMEIKNKNSIFSIGDQEERNQEQHAKLKRDFVIVVMFMLAVYIGSAVGIAMTTQDMDWRMFAVITGLSRFVGAFLIFLVSMHIPKWLCIFSSDDDVTIEESDSTRICSFILKTFLHIYFLKLLFFCGASGVKISISSVLGLLSGGTIVYGIQVARSKLDNVEIARKVAAGIIFILVVISAICFSSGCRYIEVVWGSESSNDDLILHLVSFFLWLLLEVIVSISIWRRNSTTTEVESNADLVPRGSNDDDLNIIQHPPKVDSEGARLRLEMIWTLLKQTFLICTNLLFLYLVIVNIGATYQFKIVQLHLKGAQDILYPSNYNSGQVCAWNHEPGLDTTELNITTFSTPEDAISQNLSIVHCGACAACSNWDDLRLQWTTRTHLAFDAQNCAKKSLFGGKDAVQRCNENFIGFSEECAECWTEDELCAKKNCVFIYLQSVMLNKMTNFEVGPSHITSATCDEAMCGVDFTFCSGANRRRMNIVSTIERPEDQQCRVIGQDWQTVFDHP